MVNWPDRNSNAFASQDTRCAVQFLIPKGCMYQSGFTLNMIQHKLLNKIFDD